eukprot:TRINITY_DN1689_c0_g1_i3.p1 TRINITY_DN1689_c0_g1~~TRINITY_DN1689_c0_g1_i3.p1  ORF type:complete len:327 (+),score=61.39 TRINITY_DN1689_c0_g1_i3:62-1042(+)
MARLTRQIDRYGFFVEENGVISSNSRRGITGDDKERSRAAKWRKMLSQWNKYASKKQEKLSSRIYKGIPNSVRGEAYIRLTDAKWLKQVRTNYQRLCEMECTEFDSVIRKDVDRTFPDHKDFSTAVGQEKIFRIAHSYCVLHPEVGYCQGMNFIIGALLMFMEEEDAFWVFVRMMEDFNMAGMYKGGFPLLRCHFYQFDRLLELNMPSLHRHFKELGLVPEIYTTKWFFTLFYSCFPFADSLHIMDVYMLEGVTAIFRMGLGLLKSLEGMLLAMPFEDLMPFMQSIPAQHIDFKRIHKAAKKMQVTDVHLIAIEVEYTILNGLMSR